MTGLINKWSRQLSSPRIRPAFYLIYLVFYFVPWLFGWPSLSEILLTVLIIGLFIPVHFLSFTKKGRQNILLIAVTEGFAILAAPLSASNGVFHIYAAAQAGYQRKPTISTIIFFALTAVYVATAYAFGRHLYEIIFIVFMAGIVWVSCMQEATQLAQEEQKERERELEKQQASITERERIARDLHDLLGHTLTMVSLKSDLALKLLDKDPEAARVEVNDIRTSSREALADIRAVLSGMNQTTLDSELSNAKKSLESANIALHISGEFPILSTDQEQVAALAIRESITNIIRHSNATEVLLSFSKDPQDNFIQIEDNGMGSTNEAGRGLKGLKERVAQVGGSTVIDLNRGARISVVFPQRAQLK